MDVEVRYTLNGRLREEQEELRDYQVALFNGVFLAWSPVWVVKGLKLYVWAAHPLINLMWTQSHVNELHGRGMTDWKFPTIYNKDAELVPFMRGEHSDTDVTEDLWKKVIKPDLLGLCNLKRMEDTNSEQCAQFLENGSFDQSGKLPFKVSSPFSTLVDVRKIIMTPKGKRDTLWDRLMELSVRYKFSVVPRATDYMIAPVMPALGAGPRNWYRFEELVTLQEYNMLVRDFTNTVSTLPGVDGFTGFFDIVNKKHFDQYEKYDHKTFGRLLTGYTEYGANWLSSLVDPVLRTAVTMGLQDETLFAPGYTVNAPENSENSINTSYNESTEEDSERFTKFTLNEQVFRNRTAVLKGMISFDSAPGSLLKAEMPNYNAPGEKSTVSLYGRVYSMCIILDGTPQTGTWYVLDNVRTEDENQWLVSNDYRTHPLYDKQWIRAPYLDIDGFTEPAETD